MEVNRIIEECREYDLIEPRFEEIGNSFRVTMYRKYKVNEAEAAILEILKLNNKESRKSLVEQTGFSDSKIYRILGSLKEKGILEREGSDKKGYWKILKY